MSELFDNRKSEIKLFSAVTILNYAGHPLSLAQFEDSKLHHI